MTCYNKINIAPLECKVKYYSNLLLISQWTKTNWYDSFEDIEKILWNNRSTNRSRNHI